MENEKKVTRTPTEAELKEIKIKFFDMLAEDSGHPYNPHHTFGGGPGSALVVVLMKDYKYSERDAIRIDTELRELYYKILRIEPRRMDSPFYGHKPHSL